ncbi:MAG: hypothetical protein ACLQVL_19835 [Terriglobia bacterium]
MTTLQPKQLHARLVATRDLLLDLANENQATARQITRADFDADTWFAYRKLCETLHNAASDATLLAASVSPKHEPTHVAYKEAAA